MSEARMPGFRDIDEASERIRALTVPLVPLEWASDRADVFARFGQAIALSQVLEAELRVVISLSDGPSAQPKEDLHVKRRTLGQLAKMLTGIVGDGDKGVEYFRDELARLVRERNALAHELFRTRLFTETPNSSVDDLRTDAGRQKLLERCGKATGEFAYMAVLMSDLAAHLSA